MAKVRYKETRSDSFLVNFLHEHKVSQNHFIRKLNEVIDWDRFSKKIPGYDKGKRRPIKATCTPHLS